MCYTLHSAKMFYWRTVLLLIGVLSLTSCISGIPQSFDKQQVEAEIKTLLNRIVRNQNGDINRNALLYIDAPTIAFSYAGAAGIARVDTHEPMTVDRQFIIASVAKSMTAVLIHQLAEEGVFGDKGIDTTLAELEILPPEVLSSLHRIDSASYADEITLRHLLNHTSGLRDLYFDGVDNPVSLMPGTAKGAAPDSLVGMAAFDEELGLTPLVNCTMSGIPAGCSLEEYLFRRKWAVWDYAAWQANPEDKMAGLLNFYLAGMNENSLWKPGEGFHYSDTNYVLLGLTIEKMTGHSLHHELRARVFDPLGMNDTYLHGATNPPAALYEKQVADVWAWGEPSISGGVDFSFEWGGGGIISTLEDLNTFARALVAGDLFQTTNTLEEMFTVPEGIHGISYASGLIVYPTDQGPVIYMMGSNGTWVEYYPPLDLVMIGTINDFSDMAKQFIFHGQIYQILASHGLPTPMARLMSPSMLASIVSPALLTILPIVWLIVTILRKRKGDSPSSSIKLARWLCAAAFLANLLLSVLIGITFADNPFQMLFGFSPQVRTLFGAMALTMGAFALVLAITGVQLWRRKEGKKYSEIITGNAHHGQ